MEDALAALVDEALTPVGYGWAGGVVLTDLEDPGAQRVIGLNPGHGAIIPQLNAWVSWCTPTGGLELPADVMIAPGNGKTSADWASFHAHATSAGMVVVACDAHGSVLYVLATEPSKEHAPLLALAALRTIEDSDTLPRALEDAVNSPPNTWARGWSIQRESVMGAAAA